MHLFCTLTSFIPSLQPSMATWLEGDPYIIFQRKGGYLHGNLFALSEFGSSVSILGEISVSK